MLDREDTLKKAEKLLRQGRLEAAIAEYVRVVEDQPRDWNTANTLGDLYVRAGQSDKACEQYARIADHFLQEGFYPKAAALYKKVLKITPEDETTQLHLAELSARQGLLLDARGYLTSVGARRRARGDTRGADEIVIRLGALDPSDVEARMAGASAVERSGDPQTASLRFREIHDDLIEKGRTVEAVAALREAVRLAPGDANGRAILARAAVAAGNVEQARGFLDRTIAGQDPGLLLALAEIELRAGQIERAREALSGLLAVHPDARSQIVELGWSMASTDDAAAFACIDMVVDVAVAAADFDSAAAQLQELVARRPGQIAALLKLVEVCVDGGLEASMYEAQAELADAYLSAGQPAEAQVIAEDLVAREPWERAHIQRLRRALVLSRVPDPDSVIAERLSGQTPFTVPESVPEATPVSIAPTVPPERSAAPPPVDLSVPADWDALLPPLVRAPEPAVEPPPAPRRGPFEIDLTSVLGDMERAAAPLPAPPPVRQSLDEVFSDLRNDLARQGGGGDQAEQQMTLAQTYLEMGMMDEAMASLQSAARSPRHRFEAGVLLGRLYKRQGDVPHAIEWFERAAEAPAPTPDEGRALLYNLAATLEEAGESARALAVFLELQADSGDYRDVSARVEHLSRVQTGG